MSLVMKNITLNINHKTLIKNRKYSAYARNIFRNFNLQYSWIVCCCKRKKFIGKISLSNRVELHSGKDVFNFKHSFKYYPVNLGGIFLLTEHYICPISDCSSKRCKWNVWDHNVPERPTVSMWIDFVRDWKPIAANFKF